MRILNDPPTSEFGTFRPNSECTRQGGYPRRSGHSRTKPDRAASEPNWVAAEPSPVLPSGVILVTGS
jgi:hypothetical protein